MENKHAAVNPVDIQRGLFSIGAKGIISTTFEPCPCHRGSVPATAIPTTIYLYTVYSDASYALPDKV